MSTVLSPLMRAEDLGGKVDEAFGAFLPVRSDAGDRVTGIEVASAIQNAGRQEAFALVNQGFHGSLIQLHLAARAEGKRDPVFSAGQSVVRAQETGCRQVSR